MRFVRPRPGESPRGEDLCCGASSVANGTLRPDPARRQLYDREEELLSRIEGGEDTPEVRAELEAVREAIRRHLRHELEPDIGDSNK